MDLASALLLGIMQGITEWLPISSSGHLVVVQKLLFSYNSVLFDVMVHGGTLLAVIVVFWRDFIDLLVNFLRTFLEIPHDGLYAFYSSEKRKLSWYVIIGTIPIAIVGYLLKDYVNIIFNNLGLVGFCLLVTGLWIYLTRNSKGFRKLDLKYGIIIGLAQAVAILPGISRSGSTISTGLLLGIDRDDVIRFSFLLSIPAIAGALALEVVSSPLSHVMSLDNLIGFLSSFIVGIIAIKFLLTVIRRNRFHWFSYYCFLVGGMILLSFILGVH